LEDHAADGRFPPSAWVTNDLRTLQTTSVNAFVVPANWLEKDISGDRFRPHARLLRSSLLGA